ncbi:MAG TPA: M90 family metallopeptidase [Chitinophagaceae bacterium]|nr:M90 family metallopeptidase [Chitinophagaceae bacterium]
METLIIVFMSVAGFLLLAMLLFRKKSSPDRVDAIPDSYKIILAQQVEFYKLLDEEKKKEFENRLMQFLSKVRITGVKTVVEDLDKVLIASSAIIPIFAFPEWEYINLNEVLLYPDAFNQDFEQHGAERSIAGIVGEGAYEDVMILSQLELREGFLNKTGKTNTAIHEFVHLVDKTDGSTDGIPESILSRQYILPWLELMQRKIKQVAGQRSDIDPYAATNPAEFLAVVSEYFFERPDLLKTRQPELYELLATIFRQKPGTEVK